MKTLIKKNKLTFLILISTAVIFLVPFLFGSITSFTILARWLISCLLPLFYYMFLCILIRKSEEKKQANTQEAASDEKEGV